MKKVLYCSNPSEWCTGFGKHAKTLLKGLYKRGYDIVEYAASLEENNPAVNNMPWKRYGSFPNNIHLIKSLESNKDHSSALKLNNIRHGSYYIDNVIKEEKPDVVIFTEDIWQVDSWTVTKPWWNKIPSVMWTPLDSLPLLDNFKTHKDKLKNLWVKADFAIKPLQEIGLQPELYPALFDSKDFYPLSDEEKIANKKLFGLEDTFVIGFVFRNQLRKLVLTLFEAFKKFKENNPEIKTKLLLHTCWEEGGGWKIKDGLEKIGLNPEDVITTYICRKCRNIAIIPYGGQGLNCNGCRTKGSLFNPMVQFGVTEEQLNSIYNLMDCYIHLATSGGFEMPMAEAMLAGLPTATCNYSFGETFINSGFCEPVDFSYYREGVSLYLKSQPKIDSVVSIMEKFYKNPAHYKEVGLKARNWALKHFDNESIIDRVAQFIDNSSHNYDFDFPIEERKDTIDKFIIENGKKRLLYVIPNSKDFCFVSLPIIEEIKNKYPDYDIYISCRPEDIDVFLHLSFVSNIIPYSPEIDDPMKMEGNGDNPGLFNIVFYPTAMTDKFPSYHHNGEDRNFLQ